MFVPGLRKVFASIGVQLVRDFSPSPVTKYYLYGHVLLSSLSPLQAQKWEGCAGRTRNFMSTEAN